MARKPLLVDLAKVDLSQVTADTEAIRQFNPQRFEMEQLTAIVLEDREEDICVGYKDVTDQEFWCRGHMPGMPLMPGVMMLEATAQMCSYFVQKYDLLKADMVGFGGLEEVHFRGPVVPGDRLVLICKLTKVRPRRMIVCEFQGVVGEDLVVDGVLKGIPLPTLAVQQRTADAQQ
ncbi:MAG: 3-hydroxyacyl-ACP dehydratase FabZ family protein [Pirellulaceae bacterium]